MKTKQFLSILFTICLCIFCSNIVAQNYKVIKKRRSSLLDYYYFEKSQNSMPQDYLDLNNNPTILDPPINLNANDFDISSDATIVSKETNDYIMELYLVMLKDLENITHSLDESYYEYLLNNSEIYYWGTIPYSQVLTTNVFVVSTKFEDSANSYDVICLTSNNVQTLSIVALSEYSSNGFGCYISKCKLTDNLTFQKTMFICGHSAQTRRGFLFSRNVKPFRNQYCINFKIDKSTGKIRKLLRIKI